jgi:large subunit ribosomal protein L18e
MKTVISKTKIKKHLRNKTNPATIETIALARRQKAWLAIAKIVAGSTRKHAALNLEEIDAQVKAGDIAVIPGKVLGESEITKKVKICALSFSTSAMEKIKKQKLDWSFIGDEIKKNPEAKGVKIIRNG